MLQRRGAIRRSAPQVAPYQEGLPNERRRDQQAGISPGTPSLTGMAALVKACLPRATLCCSLSMSVCRPVARPVRFARELPLGLS